MIEELLEGLYELQRSLATLGESKQHQIELILTPEIKASLDALDSEYQPMVDEANTKISALTKQIKQEVISNKSSVKSIHLHAVYTPERDIVTWNTDALDGYAINHPEIAQFRSSKPSEPSVAIRVSRGK